MENKSEVVIYQTKDGETRLEVNLQEDTVWLTFDQIVQLFQKRKSTISYHINNVFREGELGKGSTVRKYRTVQKEGKREVIRELDYYNLDVIISVGYRVKSKRGTQFRIWATNVLREHLVKGYSLDEKQLRIKESMCIFRLHKEG